MNTINIRDMGKWPLQTVGKYVSAMTKEIQISLKMCGPAIIQNIIDGTRPFPPVNTGEYRRNWKVRNIPAGPGRPGTVGAPSRDGYSTGLNSREAYSPAHA